MRRPILFGLLILFVCAVVLTIIIGLVGFNPPEFKIFANMDELSFLDQYCVDQLDDPNLEDGLSVTDRKCIEVDYNGNHFHVYAYVFLYEADARSYFDGVEATMKKNNGWHYRSYQSNRAFFAFGPSKGSRDFQALLYEHFSSTVKAPD